MATTDFRFAFEGESSEIDINTMITSLVTIGTVIQAANRKMSPETDVKVNIKATEPGSFIIHLGISYPEAAAFLRGLFTSENIGYGIALVSLLSDALSIKEHLGGKKAIAERHLENKIELTNSDNAKIVIQTNNYNIYKSTPEIDRSLTKAFEIIEQDPGIQGVSISTRDKKLTHRIDRDSFDRLTAENEDFTEDRREVYKERVGMQATKIAWDDGQKWQFVYEGNKITANITDPEFYRAIKDGRRHGQGDVYIVDLKITQVFAPDLNAYLNKFYEVTRVWEHRPRPEQMEMTF